MNLAQALPSLNSDQLDDFQSCKESAKSVWVPNRNGVLLELAAAIAEDQGADSIIVGFNTEEAVTFPDNSAAYLKAMNHALSFSTANQVTVLSPTLELTKKEIIRKALESEFPLEMLWSCYDSRDKMCGL